MRLHSDVPITGISFDALGRADVAARLVQLIALAGSEQPVVIGLSGVPGSGKTSVLYMASELLGERADLHALSIDAWSAGDAAHVQSQLTDGVTKIFADNKVVGSGEKLRERLSSAGDVVSTVARFAGVKVDVKSALERSADGLREEVMKLTEALGRRIVVVIDHVDRLPAADVLAVLKLVERWGAFPHFAFVVALDRPRVVFALRTLEGDHATLDRVLGVELAVPAIDRRELAEWVRRGLTELAEELELDPAAALALFEPGTGEGLDAIATVRDAKRLLNAVTAAAPLAREDLRTLCERLISRRA
jgi:hypothetical protein